MKIVVENLSKSYRDIVALDHMNYTFTNGIYGLLGSNGAGKTTFFNLLTDNISRSEGKILLDDKDILKIGRKYRERIGYMPQQQGRLGNYTVAGFLNEIGRLKGMSSLQIQNESREWLEKVNLTDYYWYKVDQLSGGMKQRLLLAQALMNSPDILILDEPTAGLDPRERIRIRNLIYSISGDKLVFIATHIVSDIEYIADRVLIMKKGKIIAADTPERLQRGIAEHLHEVPCTHSDFISVHEKYPLGRVLQGDNSMMYRYVSKEISEKAISGISLEDVYMYYIVNEEEQNI